MCIALFAIDVHPKFPLVLIANRDESYTRPTEDLHWWSEPWNILAGKDLQAGGSWLGINSQRALALLTNYRQIPAKPSEWSRGSLVLGALKDPVKFERELKDSGSNYAGFNLLYGEPRRFKYYNNIKARIESVGPGIHGLSNGFLDTPWPKILKGKAELARVLKGRLDGPQVLFSILQDREQAPDETVPQTGLPLETERALSPIFIESQQGYGSRSGTVVLMDWQGSYFVWERNYIAQSERSYMWPSDSAKPMPGLCQIGE